MASKSKFLCALVCFVARGLSATEPIFKFIPKASLSGLFVQSVSDFDIEMVVGTQTQKPTVFTINGPFVDGHAGMTIKSFNTVSKGSNIKSDDFMTVATKTSSTANDGLHDVGIKNISEITRVTSSTETVADNTVKLLGSMITVDKPGATTSNDLWVWASAEIADEYVWVSEEVMTIDRKSTDKPEMNFTATSAGTDELSGMRISISGRLGHTTTSRINGYDVRLRFYLPHYAEYVEDSFKSVGEYSVGVPLYKTQSSRNELVVSYPKVGITDKPQYVFDIRFKQSKLRLLAREKYNGTIRFHMTYCKKVGCSPNGAVGNFTKILNRMFSRREAVDKFVIKHVPSGRCMSYATNANNNKIVLKAACTDLFTYDVNAGLKHVSTSACAKTVSGDVKMSADACSNPLGLYRAADGLLKTMNETGKCLNADGHGKEGEIIKLAVCSNSYFQFIPEIAASSRLTMGNKVILASGNELFICSRKQDITKPPCFFANGTYPTAIKAIPATVAYIKGWDPSNAMLYGIHTSGKSYVRVNLAANPTIAFQLDDSLWDSTKNQAGMVLSTDLTDASMKDYPVQHLTTDYAVSLLGVHQKDSNTWKLLSRW